MWGTNVLLALINLLVVCYLQMWILAAQFEVRQQRLDAARKILGMSLGMCPKDRTYKAYIEVSTVCSALDYNIDTVTSCTDHAQSSVIAACPPSAITQRELQNQQVAHHFVAEVCQARKPLVICGHTAS